MFTIQQHRGITDPSNPLTPFVYALPACSLTLIPIFVESILLFRLLVVFPYHATPRRDFISIFIPLMCLKVARLVNVGLFIYLIISAMSKAISKTVMNIQTGWTNQTAFLRAEKFLQVIDNATVSCLFLYKLDIRKILAGSQTMTGDILNKSYGSTIQGLFWIAFSNFVFPVLLAIVGLIFMFHDLSFIHGIYVGIVNAYVNIVGVLLATVWVASGRWTEKRNPPAQGNNALSKLRFTHAWNNSMNTIDSSVANSDSLHEATMASEVRAAPKVANVV
ncbi:hypothetical protein AMATHDRAFT_8162 [Amanita thiersii Skay4041]|uniref:Uncharacterized protein n=1 Tax=Amanita thiersii Skay4041 TaxID=703135 RepID=A0A2A9N756_9AGAR|nr:hypothetical protein AMATHDRAFT_8162 [Amanita thiersii Skay4041]